ncbi:hypothetical protein H4Q26_008958 [Puccinia striiformis f. sp. tritici PST-130]|nr:hypothetical protein H4Q26_008958 [Puccinia striiformis f. sp. tritici PST-130]
MQNTPPESWADAEIFIRTAPKLEATNLHQDGSPAKQPTKTLVQRIADTKDDDIQIPSNMSTTNPMFQLSEDQDPDSAYIELMLPAQGPETIRELQQSVIESAEGWWLGSIGLASVELDQNGNPRPLNSSFQSEKFEDPTVKRALLAVNIDYNEYTARLHVIRLRMSCTLKPQVLLVGNSTPFPPYDPSQIGIAGAISLFPSVRGDHGNPHANPPLPSEAQPIRQVQAQAKTRRRKNCHIPLQPSSIPLKLPPATAVQESAIVNLANYRFNPANPFAAFSSLRGDQPRPANKTFQLVISNHSLFPPGIHLPITIVLRGTTST